MHTQKPVQNGFESRPAWLAVKAFALAILAGTLLLSTPLANSERHWTPPLTALFTATSATCVTGLVVEDTGSYFSPFGQVVILCLIQAGGLGIMTLGTFLLVLVGRRLRMQNEFVLMDAFGHEQVRGLYPLLTRAVGFTLLYETAGAALLAWRLATAHGIPWHSAAYQGLFHSISAFCNAGFSLNADSLIHWRSDPWIVLTVAGLLILGGLGFLVLFNLSSIEFWRRDLLRRGRLSLHSYIALVTSGILLAAGWVLFLLLEHEHTLAGLGWADKFSCAFFQAATPRTAGFNVVDVALLKPATRFVTLLLMFIGGSPGSTAGGIKTTTLVVLVITVAAMIRGRADTEIRMRTIPGQVVREAISIFMLGALCVVAVFAWLLLTEQRGLLAGGAAAPGDLLFETVSAFGTVGLSTGVTPALSDLGKLGIIVCMFVGRLGPLTLALIVGGRDLRQPLRFPEEEVVVG